MYVLDCSAAAEMVRGTERGERFVSVLEAGEAVVSSELIQAELPSVFWKYARGGWCTKAVALASVDAALDLVTVFAGSLSVRYGLFRAGASLWGHTAHL